MWKNDPTLYICNSCRNIICLKDRLAYIRTYIHNKNLLSWKFNKWQEVVLFCEWMATFFVTEARRGERGEGERGEEERGEGEEERGKREGFLIPYKSNVALILDVFHCTVLHSACLYLVYVMCSKRAEHAYVCVH